MSRICNLISKSIWPPVDWSESPRIRAVLPGKWQYIHPSPLPQKKRKFHTDTDHYQFRNFNNPFYHSPWRTVKKQYMENGKPTDTEERFLELLQVSTETWHRKKVKYCYTRSKKLIYRQPLAESARKIYPGWRMRIYHNITQEDHMVLKSQFLFPKVFF